MSLFTTTGTLVEGKINWKVIPLASTLTKPKIDFVPEVVVDHSLLTRFVDAVKSVIAEEGREHVAQPRRMSGGCGMPGCNCESGTLGMAYVFEGKGDCIVGKVLVKMGVPVERIYPFEGHPAEVAFANLFKDDPEVSRVGIIAREVQIVNDTRNPWGKALDVLRTYSL